METTFIRPNFESAFQILGKRWTGLIVSVLLDGPKRFKEIRERIPDIGDRILTLRLKELEKKGIVVRTVYPDTPVRIEYTLTQKGNVLESVIDQVNRWAHTWVIK
ncbi:helix-turn-helix domain-containing protein [Alicyclobacillus sp. SO9]|uniref:winged helix-turn-helix transcriptional regulator n=1 Tax=Alicyclobacillus sp. SO9 TaxID=2665646 RepID=UPI0018E741EA|nr:helix-turn-helix domain-containing protein [Alicyclobacillus sp. SO9]QQE78442.1 helix-turn-helix transcriptional regulator [Alicyclobacillus sp. SO9]